MLRIILIALAIYCIIRLLNRYRTSLNPSEKSNTNASSLNMVQCAHCGVHLPVNESFLIHGQYFCCTEHAQASRNRAE
ncbi:MAG: PP0621 family protein [Methylophilaceae bacterium]